MKGATQSIMAAAAVAAAALGAWYVYRRGADGLAMLATDAKQAAAQAVATAQGVWQNTIAAPFEQGQQFVSTGQVANPVNPATGLRVSATEKQAIYGNYDGFDPFTGRELKKGDWYGDAAAHLYENDQRERGALPAATSNDGAAFGIYPSIQTVNQRNALLTLQTRGRVVGGL